MDNSFELLQGLTVAEIQRKYEYLSDIVAEAGGKVFGSQSHISSNNNNNKELTIIVYYEVPEGKREKVKRKYKDFVRNMILLERN
jgi:hypothetical protein